MRINIKAFRLTILSFFFFFSTVNAQDSLNLQQRVKILEQYNEKVLKEEFETQENKLSSSIEIQLNDAKAEVLDQLWILKITGGVIALILAIGLGAVLYQYFRGLRKIADAVLREKLHGYLGENSSHILELITSQKVENLIRKSKKIFIVSGSEADLQQCTKLLKDTMKFSHVEGGVFRYYEKPPSCDLVIFSSRDGSLPEELMKEFLEKGADSDHFIYFSGHRFNVDPKAKYTERLSFANTQFTLYLQIINMLSFKELLIA